MSHDIKATSSEVLVVKEEVVPEHVGEYIGQCKWFNDKLGYGFVTICNGVDKGKDIFVHHTGVRPLNSHYKTLRKGEYIQFDIMDGQNGQQAVNVMGIGGGPLMCDFVTTKLPLLPQQSADMVSGHQWQTVPYKKNNHGGGATKPYRQRQRDNTGVCAST